MGSGGTWLGINVRSGRLAFLTNLRSLDPIEPTSHNSSASCASRGELVTNFLTGSASPQEYMQSVPGDHYQGFNLVVGHLLTGGDSQVGAFAYINNSPDSGVATSSSGGGGGSSSCGAVAAPAVELLEPGRIYGLSNGRLMEWPKVTSGIRALQELLPRVTQGEPVPYDRIFGELLGDSKRLVPLKTSATGTGPASGSDENAAGAAADIPTGRQHAGDDAVEHLTTTARARGNESVPQDKGEEAKRTGAAVAAANPACGRGDSDSAASIETYDLDGMREGLEHITSGRFVAAVQSPWGLYGTRSQTVIVVWHDGSSEVRERHRRDDGTWGEEVVLFSCCTILLVKN
ncbi:hypothetical protein VOLCADRAFT_97345 [Volvox carteri f. nagariensis]|uniref:Uncharacterized protein n=1 Tax=Volvox carteri f. nagariensis TaxID=3068 RepID=D8UCI3_VOLCA|nr:uncharacterized protein VOLCADRAFT_97345 [Volvox carteri f. nagariensis]EFJ42556.1 hypothetical protein VOLCADRAFT_97345 [Volvox carteri f. nagariensis]|eukprot:XP_002956412.1 hypothetical protein VOLCADRAFT_97345 [Volvox carteri f. nagariensis]